MAEKLRKEAGESEDFMDQNYMKGLKVISCVVWCVQCCVCTVASCVMCHVSYVLYHVSCVMYHV